MYLMNNGININTNPKYKTPVTIAAVVEKPKLQCKSPPTEVDPPKPEIPVQPILPHQPQFPQIPKTESSPAPPLPEPHKPPVNTKVPPPINPPGQPE
ncbi:unnamed protein product [Allacma fusca]|uniref:Uncharacterized protein n=1 Tax=Allacma fusca TaxID=39272 RepID=A0A8J2PFE1_9HEXA|nr:unnamed protein product [Allacma fusca]